MPISRGLGRIIAESSAIIAGSPSNIGVWTFIGVVRIYYRGRRRTFFFHARRRRTISPIDPSIPQDLRSSLKAARTVPDRRVESAVAVNPRR